MPYYGNFTMPHKDRKAEEAFDALDVDSEGMDKDLVAFCKHCGNELHWAQEGNHTVSFYCLTCKLYWQYGDH